MAARRTVVLPARPTVLAALFLAGAVVAPLSIAHADPTPKPPTQEQVDQAKRAANAAGEEVARLDAAYAAAADRLEEVGSQAAATAEMSNGATLALRVAERAERDAADRAARTRAAASGAVEGARDLAAQAYQGNGSLGEVGALLEVGGPAELADRLATLDLIGGIRRDVLARAATAANVLAEAERAASRAREQRSAAAATAVAANQDAEVALATATAETQRVAAEQARMLAELARLRKTSVAIEKARQDGLEAEAERRRAEEEERRRRAEEERRKRDLLRRSPTDGVTPSIRTTTTPPPPRPRTTEPTRPPTTTSTTTPPPRPSTTTRRPRPTRTTSTTSTTSTTATPSPTTTTERPRPPRAGADAAIAYARAQLGKWYRWGGEGPDTFDCSGLTMMAWRQAGVYLSHYTGAQWSETKRIAIDDLLPGDLVFFGSSGANSHHVGLYIGDGQMIEAPHTGAQIRIRSIYRKDLVPYGGRP